MTNLGSCVIVMTKYPAPGEVKTRLAANLGDALAAALYRCFVQDVLATTDSLSLDVFVSIYPFERQPDFAQWLGSGRRFLPQRGQDLGARMADAFTQVFAQGFTRAVLIGSDLPDLPASRLSEAFSALADHDAVLGPASDGGFYLIGWNSPVFRAQALTSVLWSTPLVLTETLAALAHEKRTVFLLDNWPDVDTMEDLELLAGRERLSEQSATLRLLRDRRMLLHGKRTSLQKKTE